MTMLDRQQAFSGTKEAAPALQIDAAQLDALATALGKTGYGQYLKDLLREETAS